MSNTDKCEPAKLVEVAIVAHKTSFYTERCLNGLIQVPAGIEYDLLFQPKEQTEQANWNDLYEQATAKWICMLQDDSIPASEGWLKALVDVGERHEDAGMVMPIHLELSGQPPRWWTWIDQDECEVKTAFGFCQLVRTGIGLAADEAIPHCTFVDWDLSEQAKALGWKIYFTNQSKVMHGKVESHPRTGLDRRRIRLTSSSQIDTLYLTMKWNWDIAFIHHKQKMAINMAPANLNVIKRTEPGETNEL